MVWKDFKCEGCGEVQENVPSKTEDTERECPSCGSKARLILHAPPIKFKGGGWATRRPIETFPDEPDDPADWGKDTHGVEASKNKGKGNASY